MENIGLAIRKFREKIFPGHGGQTLMAKKAGVDKSRWSYYENAKKLSVGKLKNIAKALEISLDELLQAEQKISATIANARPENIIFDKTEKIKNLVENNPEIASTEELNPNERIKISRGSFEWVENGYEYTAEISVYKRRLPPEV